MGVGFLGGVVGFMMGILFTLWIIEKWDGMDKDED